MKRLFTSIAIIFLILVGALFTNDTKPQHNTIPKIGVLQFLTHPALDEIYRGIHDQLNKEGFVDGKTIHIDFQNAQGNQSNLTSMATKFDNENVDLAVGIATPAAQSLANAMPNRAVLFAPSTDPISAGLLKNIHHPEANVTGVSDQAPLKQQLALIKKIIPNLTTLGIIYTSSDVSATTEAKKMLALAQKAHIKTKTFTIAQANDLTQVTQTMVANSDINAIFVPTDNTIASSMAVLINATNKANIPVFPTSETMVAQGGVAAESINQYEIGVKTAQMISKILHGQKIAATSVEFMKQGHLIINLKAAKQLNIPINDALLKQVTTEKGRLIK